MPDLTPKQHKAAGLLAQGMSQVNVCAAVPCGHATLWRWQKRDDFQLAVVNTRVEQARRSLVALDEAGDVAVNTLVSICESPTVPPMTRVAAAKTLIEAAQRGLFHVEALLEIKHLQQKEAVINAEFTVNH